MPETLAAETLIPPAITGPRGRAWRCDRITARRTHGLTADPVVADWIIELPGLHHAFSAVHLALQHLRPLHPGDAIARAVPDASHELWVMGLDPHHRMGDTVHGTGHPHHIGYCAQIFATQLPAHTDAEAITRLTATITLICNGELNPIDQDQWISLFGAAMLKGAA